MKDIMKMVKSLKDFGLMIRGATKIVEKKTKEQRNRFLSMLSSTLGASLLEKS